jgi:hypothetical protein
VLPF